MKNSLLVFMFLIITVLIPGQKPILHIKYSEPLSVFIFLKKLSTHRGDNPFKTVFKNSIFNTIKYQELITKFDNLKLDYTFQFYGYPYGSKFPGMTEALLKKNLIAASSLKEFKLNSTGLLPNNSINELVIILSEFTPIYNELIYNPNKVKFEKQIKDISNYVIDKDISEYFEIGLTFYNSNWDYSIPFEVVFYPLPDSPGFTAEAFYNNAVCAIQNDFDDFNLLVSVMLHEAFHIIYDEQSLNLKKDIYSYFKENTSKYSTYAYLLLNESLATAFGNGYVYESLIKKPDTTDWYNRKYINLMAKKIYPIVKEYIIKKKSIDKEFIDEYIRLYEKDYPNWINELDNTMTYRYIMTENEKDLDIFSTYFPYCSMSEEEDRITEAGIEKMKATPLSKVIIVSKNNKIHLNLIKKKFTELKNWNYKAEKEFVYNVLLNDKTQLYIINQLTTPTEGLIKNLP
ncbi:hypothetical protein [Chryseobacterium viscerum]|uniref:DUF4932 domain-containing protein n=1 Tax=Chryseobacterium viscerum TaxID=1037377 RepID=A0A316WND1_9FLAO|nr:hypothetical protein [Chryseobacterium viscerum]PWN62707.1 hypothetical protein C1634_007975 [Chryseobacterium viscerum]